MDPQHNGPVAPVEIRRRSPDEILRNTIVNQATQIASLMAIADVLPAYRAEIERLRGELEKVQADLTTLRAMLEAANGDTHRNG